MQENFYIQLLSVTWILPLLGAVFTILVPQGKSVKILNLWVSALNLVICIALVAKFYVEIQGVDLSALNGGVLAFQKTWLWIPSFNIEYKIGVDGISILMMLLTSIVIFCGVFASMDLAEQSKEFFILLNVLVSGVYGVFISLDLFTFFVFYEIAVLPMYLLIGLWGTGRKEYASMKLVLMLVAGSALIFTGILALYFESGLHSFDMLALKELSYPLSFQKWVFPSLFIGFGVLGALFPFHTWSPDGHASAPTAVSMLHAGVLMKLGGYGCLKVAMFLLPEGAQYWMNTFLILVTINVVYGSFAAIKQTDLKYVTAYSSVSHCGLVLFGFAVMTVLGFKGAVLQMISHGLMTALFFCLIGFIYGRTHTRTMSEMGGLMKKIPFLSVAFVIVGLAGLGLPSLSGFVAEVTIFMGSFFQTTYLTRVCTVLAILSIVVTAVYVLRTANTMLMGPLNEKFSHLKDASLIEKVPVIILIFCLFAMGIFPSWIIRIVDTAVYPIFNQVMR